MKNGAYWKKTLQTDRGIPSISKACGATRISKSNISQRSGRWKRKSMRGISALQKITRFLLWKHAGY